MSKSWDWLGTKRVWIAKTWLFSFPDARHDRCCACAVERGLHKEKDHAFKETRNEKQD